MDGHGHGHGDGRLKRSGTIWNGPERNETKWNEVKNLVTVTSRSRHVTVTFSVKNERFTVLLSQNISDVNRPARTADGLFENFENQVFAINYIDNNSRQYTNNDLSNNKYFWPEIS